MLTSAEADDKRANIQFLWSFSSDVERRQSEEAKNPRKLDHDSFWSLT